MYMRIARKFGTLFRMRLRHTFLSGILLLGLGYSQCTGGLLSIPYALALEATSLNGPMSVAQWEDFSCFQPLAESFEPQPFSSLASVIVDDVPVDNPCSEKECDVETDEEILQAPTIRELLHIGFPAITAVWNVANENATERQSENHLLARAGPLFAAAIDETRTLRKRE
jgi:hypothetical protein